MAQQVVRRSALIDATTIKIAAVIDMPEVRQRVSQRHHAAEVGDVFIRDYLALSAAAEGVGELDAIRNVINQKPSEAVHPEPEVEPVRADIDALNQQRDNARLLGGEEFVPQRIELLQGRACVGRFMSRWLCSVASLPIKSHPTIGDGTSLPTGFRIANR